MDIRSSKLVRTFMVLKKDELKAYLIEAFNQFKNNTLDLALNKSEQFHRKKLTQDLATIIVNNAVHI